MSFNAGSIEASLTLDRSPFQRGLDEAKAEGAAFERESFSARLDVTGDVETKRKIDSVEVSAEKLASLDPTVQVEADTSGVQQKIDAVEVSAQKLAATKPILKIDGDAALLTQKIAKAQADLAELERQKATPKIDLDIVAAEVARQKLVDELDALQAKKADPKIDLDIAAAELKRIELVARLDELQTRPFTAKMELDAAKVTIQIAQVQQRLEALAAKKTALEIDTDEAAILVKIATVQERIDRLNGQKTTINIDADIGATEAKIAALQAQLAALSAGTTEAGSAASAAATQFNFMAVAVASGVPPAATAVLQLSGALALAIAPMVAIQVGMTGIQAAAAPLVGEFLNLQSVVSATFEQGLKPAITDVSALMPTLTSGLVGTAGALTTVATQVGLVASSANGLADLQAIFSNVTTTISSMAPGIAGVVQNFLDLAAIGTGSLVPLSTIVNGLSTQWHDLVTELTSSGQAQGAMSSLVSVLGAVAAVIPPIVSAGVQLMDVLGPPLTGAVQLLGGALNLLTGPLGGLTTTVLAGAAAWKVLSVVVNAGIWETIGSKIAATAAAMGIGTTATAAATVATEGSTAALAGEAVAATAAAEGIGRVTAAAGFAAAAQGSLAGASAGAAASTATAGAAAGGAAAGAGRFATALAGIGSAIVPVGVALVAGYVALKQYTVSIDDAVSALQRGGQSAADMTAKLAEQAPKVAEQTDGFNDWTIATKEWINTNIWHVATVKNTTAEYDKQRAAMTPLQRAQADATIAQGNLTKAQNDYLPGSAQVIAAQKAYATATLAVTQAQAGALVSQANLDASLQAASLHFGDQAQKADGAAQATIAWANALATLADPLASAADKTAAFAADIQNASDAPRNLLSAMTAADKSITSFAESTLKITPAMIDASGAINTATKAGQELATGILGSAKAYDNLYGATIASAQANGDDMPTAFGKAAVASEDFRQKMIAQAIQHGATREAAEAMVDSYLAIPKEVTTQISQPGMLKGLVDAMGLKDAVVGIPDSKSVIVKSLTADAQKQLEDLGLTVTKMPNGQILITADGSQATAESARVMAEVEKIKVQVHLNAEPSAFQAGSAAAFRAAESASVQIPLGADPGPLQRTLTDEKGKVATTPFIAPVEANPAAFNTALSDIKGQMASSTAVQPISGDPVPFYGVVESSRLFAGSALAVVPLDANPESFNGKVTQSITLADGSKGTIALDGNPALVNGKVTSAVSFADGSKGTITVDGNPNPATGQITAVVDFGNGKHTVITIDPKDLASSVIAAIPRAITTTVTIVTVGATVPAGTSGSVRVGGAGGGLVGFSGGGVIPDGALRMATGGVMPGYAPGVDNIPAILSPGEAVLVPELVKQIGPGNILAANMAASGRQPTFWNGAKPQGGDGVALGPLTVGGQVSSGSGGAAEFVAAAVRQLRDESADTRKATAELSSQVRELASVVERSGTGASIVVNDRSGNPVETAREAMLRARLRR